MVLMQMDRIFLKKLEHLLYPDVRRAKDYNSHLLQYLPSIISAYKGLVHGKDQRSYDDFKLEEICQYIQQQLHLYYTVPPVEDIAAEAFISYAKLNRLFSNLGMTSKRTVICFHSLIYRYYTQYTIG